MARVPLPFGDLVMRRRLLVETLVYGFGGMANQAVNVLLVPVYAAALGAAGFGLLAVITSTLTLATMLAGLALHQAFFRFYLGHETDERDRPAVLAKSLGTRLLLSIVSSGIVLIAAVPLAQLIADADAWILFALLAPVVLADSLATIPLSYLRAERRPTPYIAISFSRALFTATVAVILVVVLDLGIMGAVLGMVVGASASMVIALAILWRQRLVTIRWDPAFTKAMLRFALPLLPAVVAGWTLNLADRYIINAAIGPQAVGIYAAGYSIGLLVNVLAVQPFGLAFAPAKWEIAKEESAPERFSSVMTTYVAVAGSMALAITALAPDAVRLLLPAEFAASATVVPLVAFAYVVQGIYTIASTGLILQARTSWIGGTMVAAALLTAALTVGLVLAFGYIGAAVATFVGYCALAVGTAVVSHRVYAVPWAGWRIAAAVGIGLMLGTVAVSMPHSLALRAAVVVAFPVILFALRMLQPQDVRWARTLLGRYRTTT